MQQDQSQLSRLRTILHYILFEKTLLLFTYTELKCYKMLMLYQPMKLADRKIEK